MLYSPFKTTSISRIIYDYNEILQVKYDYNRCIIFHLALILDWEKWKSENCKEAHVCFQYTFH